MIKLILTDIDGTILPAGQKVVSERTRDAIYEAQAAGIRVGVATGRFMRGVPPLFGGDASCVQTAFATNGMQVYLDGRLIHEEFLDHDQLEEVAKAVRAIPGAGLVCFSGPDLAQVDLVVGTVEGLRASFSSYADICVPADDVPEAPVAKANVYTPVDRQITQEVFERLCREVPGIGFNLPMPGFLNVIPLGYSKATGIDILCEALGISLDEVVVFGDAGNDIEMIEHVPNSVAVANADPEVLAAARWHIGPCTEESVASAIEALARDEWPFFE